MKKILLVSGVFMAAVLTSQSALADFRVRGGVSSTSYELGGDYIVGKSVYTPVNLGMTFAADSGLYVDLAVSGGTGEHDGWATANAPTTVCGGTSCGNLAAPAESFSRSDAALIIGGSMLNQNNGIAGTFYGGVKSGTTTLGAENTGLAWTEETFTTSGIVLGGGISFPIASGRAGAVGVNLGLGLMEATWEDTTGYNVKSKTAVGGSFGVSYTYPITSSFGIVADYKGNSYKYNFGDATVPFNVTESINALTATAYFKF